MILLTKERLEALRTDRGGYTTATTRALGLSPSDFKKGWINKLTGQQINDADYLKALEGRNIYSKNNSSPVFPKITDSQRHYIHEIVNNMTQIQAQSAIAALLEIIK